MIEKLVDHMYWANARILAWLEDGANATDGRMRLVSHILNVERVWISRARGVQGDRETFKVRALAELADLNGSNHGDFKALIQGDLKKAIGYQMFNGTPVTSVLEDMVVHAFSHGFHHAGQIAAEASAVGAALPDVSYLGFTRSKTAS
jgi:uncharacterized damage-inducible protein DinB